MTEYAPDFPQYLSSPTTILWWEFDQVIIAFFSFTFALLQGGIVMWTGFFLVNFLYSRTKKNKPRGFLKHLFYMFGFSHLSNYPEYFQHSFHE